MERNALQEIKVGIFVAVFIGLIVLASFILGGGEDLFASRYVLHTSYEDVKGMKVGAVVRLAGMDVGEVSRVEFASDVGVKEIEVDLTIRTEFKERIRGDSVASIQQIGVLGDMYVGITVGTVDQPALEHDGTIKGVPAFDVLDYATTATDIVSSAASISRKLDYMLGSDEAAKQAEIAKSIANIGLMLEEAKNGKGLLHTLIYDEGASSRFRNILTNVEGMTADAHDITTEVRTGDGVANALIYGEGGQAFTASLTEAAAAVNGLLSDLKSQDSVAHALLYDPERAKLIDELTAASTALRETAEAVNNGEGTAGLLVKDPQLYEDMRALLGGAQRNALLRAYIRATIAKEKDETAGAFEGPEAGE